ncbi:hypothetical protein GCM10010440_76980 [Kitasatospora cinereorecta]
MPFTARQRHGMAAVLFAAAVLCTSCSSSGHPAQQPDAITADQTAVEYKAEAARLVLSPGWSWPADPTPTAKGPDGAPQLYQRGWGTTRADTFWYCSWQRRYLDPAVAPTDRDAALSQLKKVRDTHFYQADLLPADQKILDDQLSHAGLGDTTDMQNNVDVNCPGKGEQ